jgi:hypothetical protein
LGTNSGFGGAVSTPPRAWRSRAARSGRAPGVVEAVGPARRLQLVAAERAEQLAEVDRARGDERLDLLVLRAVRRDGDREDATQLDEPGLG